MSGSRTDRFSDHNKLPAFPILEVYSINHAVIIKIIQNSFALTIVSAKMCFSLHFRTGIVRKHQQFAASLLVNQLRIKPTCQER